MPSPTQPDLPDPIRPTYEPAAPGRFLLYQGPLDVAAKPEPRRRLTGRLELRLEPSPSLRVKLVGNDPWLFDVLVKPLRLSVQLPPGANLQPPPPTATEDLEEPPPPVIKVDESVDEVQAGDLAAAHRLTFHVPGAITDQLTQTPTTAGHQHQANFELDRWRMCLALTHGGGFPAVLNAVPPATPVDLNALQQVADRLYTLLGLIAGQAVGVLPITGHDNSGQVVWAHWAVPQYRPGGAAIRWCPKHLVHSSLPTLATGLTAIGQDQALSLVVKRAINHLLAVYGDGVLEVRIPACCTGIELLGWALLQRHQWLQPQALADLTAAAITRLLLHWAGIPIDIPEEFTALHHRRRRLAQAGWEGPEVLFNIRNNLVHPPKRLDAPEWPTGDEVIQAWQLATWYLELIILRTLDYHGHHWSRLRLGRSAYDTEPVPWA